MYKKILRPLLFLLQPEAVHNLVMGLLRFARYVPFAKSIMRAMFTDRDLSLEREVLGITFANPVGLAAGFDKKADTYDMLGALGFGFIEIGTVTPQPQPGNPKPRSFRLAKDNALINRMGINNEGMEKVIGDLRGRNPGLVIGGNIGKNSSTPNNQAPADFLKIFRAMYDYVDYFTVNVSCPNVTNLRELQDRGNMVEILGGLREFRKGQSEYRPILIKISPDLTLEQVDVMIDVVKECRIDGIVATNTTTSREGLKTDAKIIDRIGNGGLSGAPLTERSLDMVRYISRKTEGKLPIMGVGGIMTVHDALRMLDAGACVVQLYTGFIYNGPGFVKKICRSIACRNAKSVAEK